MKANQTLGLQKFGLKEEQLEQIISAIKSYPQIQQVKIFGSRAIGNYKMGSDVDLCLYGDKTQLKQVSKKLKSFLENETNLPYFFDILIYDNIRANELKEHVDLVGIDILS